MHPPSMRSTLTQGDSMTANEPDDTEGDRLPPAVWRSQPDDVEGHRLPPAHLADESDEPDDTEGHRLPHG